MPRWRTEQERVIIGRLREGRRRGQVLDFESQASGFVQTAVPADFMPRAPDGMHYEVDPQSGALVIKHDLSPATQGKIDNIVKAAEIGQKASETLKSAMVTVAVILGIIVAMVLVYLVLANVGRYAVEERRRRA